MPLAVLAASSAEAAPDSPVTSAKIEVGAEALAAEEFGRFYDRTRLALRAYLAVATRDGGLADDLTQEAFIRLYTAKAPFANDEHRRRYLFRIASNLLNDHWRKARHAELPLDGSLLGLSAQATSRERPPDLDTRRDLSRALGKLAPRERQLVWLAYVEHLSHREIAAAAGVGATSVRVLLFRARRRLAEALRDATRQSAKEGAAR